MKLNKINKDVDAPVELAPGVFWVGFFDAAGGLQCNPYLIIDGDEAVLIDGGSRPHFSSVMMKILQTGVEVNSIKRLIYQHYDPDLCGNLPNLEDIIDNKDLRVLSHRENNIFIKYYSTTSPRDCIQTQGFEFVFSSGRKLEFIHTPYAHSAGSFMTFDVKNGILFSSDLFGTYGKSHDLFLKPCEDCKLAEKKHEICEYERNNCNISGIVKFHRRIMTSNKALRLTLDKIQKLPFTMIAPQHGTILSDVKHARAIMEVLYNVDNIGIDGVEE